jgi:hypothetical protein
MGRAIHPHELSDPDFESMIDSYCQRNEQAKVTSSAAGTTVIIVDATIAMEPKAEGSLSLGEFSMIRDGFKRKRKLPGV